MLYLLLYLFKPIIWLIMMPKVYGNKNELKRKGKVIFVCNHISMGDPILIALISPRVVHFMAKKEIFRSPIAGFFLKLLYVFPVDRGIPDIKSIKRAINLLNKGKVFGIFPEGRRAVAPDHMDELELGTGLIAMRSGAPVIPIYIHHESFKKWRIRVIVGNPITSNDISDSLSRREKEVVFMHRMANAFDALKNRLDSIVCK